MHALTGSKILVVEDDSRMCESIRYLLGYHGFDVQTSENLLDALNALLAIEYDLVLLDLQLEDKSGFAVMDHLVERNMDTQVIVVTGLHSESYAIRALKKGATDYLKKPFEPDDLLASVNKVLGQQERQRELCLFHHIAASTSEAIIVGEHEGRIVYSNAAYRKLINPDTPALDDPSAIQKRPANTDVVIDEQIRKALETGMPWEGTVDMVTAAGGRFSAWKRVDTIPEAVGGVTYGFALMHDITAQIENERAITSSRERYRRVIDSQKDYVCRLNRDFEITFANKAYADCLEKTPRSMIGRPYMTLIQDSIQHTLFDNLVAVRSASTPIEIEYKIKDPQGCTRWQQWRFHGIVDKNGHVSEIQCVGRDVTRKKMIESDRKLSEKRLQEESEKLKQALTKVKRLSGMLPICASCKMIRDDKGYWNQIEAYIANHSEAEFSHGICPNCARKLYPELYEE